MKRAARHSSRKMYSFENVCQSGATIRQEQSWTSGLFLFATIAANDFSKAPLGLKSELWGCYSMTRGFIQKVSCHLWSNWPFMQRIPGLIWVNIPFFFLAHHLLNQNSALFTGGWPGLGTSQPNCGVHGKGPCCCCPRALWLAKIWEIWENHGSWFHSFILSTRLTSIVVPALFRVLDFDESGDIGTHEFIRGALLLLATVQGAYCLDWTLENMEGLEMFLRL